MAKQRGRKPIKPATTSGEREGSAEADQNLTGNQKSEVNERIFGEIEKESVLEEVGEQETLTVKVQGEGKVKGNAGNKVAQPNRRWSELFAHNREGQNGLQLERIEEEGEEVVVSREEVEPEVRFWRFSLVAYIVSQNIPVPVMVGFLRFCWRGLVMPHVVKHEDGYFILRFEKLEDMEAALAKGTQFFYSKPMILKRWIEGLPKQEDMRVVPVWIQLPKLPLGFWGAKTLSRIASKVGEPVKTDELTAKKLKIEYARIMVNVEVGKELPEFVAIRSEVDDSSFQQQIRYEWVPECCKRCRKWGHKEGGCNKPVQKQWQVKEKVSVKEKEKADPTIQIIIGKEKVDVPTQGKNKESDGNRIDKGKGIERMGKDDKGECSSSSKTGKVDEEVLEKLFQMMKQEGRKERANPKPPDK